jgi:hypothetical protein
MCNAWNHPINCTCGWGGDGHLGRNSSGSLYDRSPSLSSVALQYSSYTNPNASCPVCGKKVFFYESLNGGRVYFDELGPPWPKHPCTSTTTSRLPLTSIPRRVIVTVNGVRQWTWQADGWIPFLIDELVQLPPDFKYCHLKGKLGDSEIILYAKKKDLEKRALFQVRKVDDVKYQISTVPFGASLFAAPVVFFAYPTTVQLRQEEKNRFTSNGNKTKTRIGINNEGSGRIKSETQARSMLENVKTVRQNQDKRVQRIIEGSLQESLRRYIETKRK